jgi:2-amino-4-hydroxy-6-hydroxymethyldihydropteridine diphosphokinase
MEHEPSPAPVAAYVALGANLDDPAAQVRAGLRALAALPETRLVRRSSLYRSPPEGGAEQPDYVNAVAALETRLAPRALLERLLEIERAHGRVRSARNAPRRLDLDLLLYGALELEEPDLAIPHPRMHRRAFVLVPLAEIAPEARVPGHGRAADLAQSVDASGLVRLEEASGADEDARAGAGT